MLYMYPTLYVLSNDLKINVILRFHIFPYGMLVMPVDFIIFPLENKQLADSRCLFMFPFRQ